MAEIDFNNYREKAFRDVCDCLMVVVISIFTGCYLIFILSPIYYYIFNVKCDDTCRVSTAFLIVTIITLFIIGLVWCAIHILANHRLQKDLEMKEFQKTECVSA